MYHFKTEGKARVSRCTFVATFPLITFEVESAQPIYLIALLLQINLKREGVQNVQGQFMLNVQLWSEAEQNLLTHEEGNGE